MRKYEVTINGKLYSIFIKEYNSESAELEIDGEPYTVDISGPITGIVDNAPDFPRKIGTSSTAGAQPSRSVGPLTPSAVAPVVKPSACGDKIICAPIPGSILEINVQEGSEVTAGQLLLKMEAMKMENEITANYSGKVVAIKVAVGDSVNQGDVMIEIG